MPLRLSTGMRNGLLGTDDFKGLFTDGVLRIFSGVQPTSADDAETGTLLCEITVSSGAFTPGAADNGLEFGAPVSGTIAKATGEVWSGVAVTTGTAGWFRFYSNARTMGASGTGVRFDGSISTSGAQLNMSSTALTAGATTTLDGFTVTMPAS